jgi:hypothetical protein
VRRASNGRWCRINYFYGGREAATDGRSPDQLIHHWSGVGVGSGRPSPTGSARGLASLARQNLGRPRPLGTGGDRLRGGEPVPVRKVANLALAVRAATRRAGKRYRPYRFRGTSPPASLTEFTAPLGCR